MGQKSLKNVTNEEKKMDFSPLGMNLVKRNLKSFGRMGYQKELLPIGINPVKRNLKSFLRMEDNMEYPKNGMKMETLLFKETL